MRGLKEKLRYQSFPFGIYGLLLVIILVFLGATQGNVSPAHLLNIARSAAPLGIAAMGQTIVLIAGGLDLSMGATISMVNLVAASVMNGSRENMLPAVAISLGLCLVVGFFNGFIITRFQMQPFLVTMAMGIIIQGCYYLYTQGIARGNIAREMRFISEGWVWGIPVAVMIWLALWLVLSVALKKTIYGRKLYLTGANPAASKLSGYQADRITISAYMMGALLAGVAGLMLSAYIGVASVDMGLDYTLNTVASSVIGGAAFTGGIGSLEGTFPGVLIITILQSLTTILGISEAGKFICQGAVIAVMVAINQRKASR